MEQSPCEVRSTDRFPKASRLEVMSYLTGERGRLARFC